ncbi:glycosyltransferase family 2 protein [Flavobacterium sp. UMI-01]|uniref:glycosyltransferase family 2 protein n=1 Tax=Flavobacterium sp. UMI-01 TaxID=1441053 RepID=UPI001C7DC7C2|nr:glycosyltransferase family 2 protein [Flavobacterium sp. UMI-01]GIZ07430.1 glycosyl transferase [Flavobacterium sp. UMI-01]
MSNKLITIITVVYNAVDMIEETIDSIIQHDSSFFEYIIIDGGSNDGTVEIIKRYLDKISIFVSEPDKGIYDAMNKGIKYSSGNFIAFINCGDKLLHLPVQQLIQHPTPIINCFPVKLSTGFILNPFNNWTLKIRNTLPHQGCFYKRTDGLKYDISYKVFADFDLNQNIYKNKSLINVFNGPLVAFHDTTGISNDKKYSQEIFKVVKQNFGLFYQLISWLYFKKQGVLKRLKNLIS